MNKLYKKCMYMFAFICTDYLYKYTKYIGNIAFYGVSIEWQETDMDRWLLRYISLYISDFEPSKFIYSQNKYT